MRKKTKFIISSLAVCTLLLVFVVPVFARNELGSFMSEWGRTLKGYATNQNGEEPEIYAKGNSTIITKEEVQQATDFYILSGMDKEAAEKEAIKYVMEREALYQEAIRSGYAVTDDEVRSYLEELKETIDTADNKEDAYAVIDSFGSEEEYWDYLFTVYQKDLPIQKYVDSLKTKYETRTTEEKGTLDFMDEFNSYYNEYKQSLVDAENYHLVD